MRSLFMAAVAVLMMGATTAFAQKPNLSREPFVISVGKLSDYLQLTPSQIEEVANINEYFIEKQAESTRCGSKNRDRKQYEAVYGNLKLMKKALTAEQYRKYVTLINVTNNNNRMLAEDSMPDVYLADNAK